MRHATRIVGALGAALLVSGIGAGPTSARATRSARANVDKVKDLVSPGMDWCVSTASR